MLRLQVPGPPAEQQQDAYTPPVQTPAAEQPDNIAGDENETDDAPVVQKVTKPVVKKVPTPQNVAIKPSPKPITQPIAKATPAPPKPKAVYGGGVAGGTGGNNADSYNGVRNQGIAGGNGDQGSANGNPNSDSYKGNASSGNSGVRIRSGLGGRRFTRLPSFEDDFNENAKVAVDITVDKSGNVTTAVVNAKGTTTTNRNIRCYCHPKSAAIEIKCR